AEPSGRQDRSVFARVEKLLRLRSICFHSPEFAITESAWRCSEHQRETIGRYGKSPRIIAKLARNFGQHRNYPHAAACRSKISGIPQRMRVHDEPRAVGKPRDNFPYRGFIERRRRRYGPDIPSFYQPNMDALQVIEGEIFAIRRDCSRSNGGFA